MKILYVTAHMGGGAGKAIAGMAVSCNQVQGEEHKILLLEEPEKLQHVQSCQQNQTELVIMKDGEEAGSLLEWADVIVVNWWHHPKLTGFLADFPKTACRVVLWCHVNGCVYPHLPYRLAKQCERLLFTTPYSLENPDWSREQAERIAEKSDMISGIGQFHPQQIDPKKNYENRESFTVGYVGTLNFAKLHKDYFLYCKEVVKKIPDVHFLMVGDYEDSLLDIAKTMGLEDYFTFTGYVEDVYPYLEQMDVFGYLLSSENYATTENAILEAMAFGLPAVAYKNKPEQCIITEGKNGFLVGAPEEYALRIEQLRNSSGLREQIGKQARESVIQRYSCEQNRDSFLNSMKQAMQNPKRKYEFSQIFGKTPYDWFLSCTGKDWEIFQEYRDDRKGKEEVMREFLLHCNPIYKELTKSSISHFASYYPEDSCLAELNELVKEIRNSTPGGKRTPLAEALPLSVPYLVQIFPVYGCNFRCEYCIHSLDRSEHGYISEKTVMEFKLFQKIIDDMKKAGWKPKMLRFAAIGEPLLHKDIAKMVAYAKQAEISESIDIVTNASLLTKELSDALISSGLTRLRISLEGLSKSDYQKHVSAEVDFGKLVENIRYFYEHCKDTKVYIKIIDYMVPTQEKQEYFYQLFQPICHSLAVEHLTPTIEKIDYGEISGNRKNDRPQNGETLIESDICPQPFYMMQINPDGNVVPCCSMKYPAVLGNVVEHRIEEVWDGAVFQSFQRRMLEGVDKASEVCRTCTLYRYDLHQEDKLDDAAKEILERFPVRQENGKSENVKEAKAFR